MATLGGDAFEFAALEGAVNYRRALAREFAPHLRGRVLEVGAGVGQFTALLEQLPGIESLVAVEPVPEFCQVLRRSRPGPVVVEGTIEQVQPGTGWDALVSVNVLEHIADDQRELHAYARALALRHGVLCLFVPASPRLYAPIDRALGHHRRYGRSELRGKLERAGFDVLRLDRFNSVGYVLWWLNFRVLRQQHFAPRAVRWFDRWIFPWVHWLESRLVRPPFGQSLIAAARAS
ncbi:MAG: class I SAM-dependent methyltransferase [Verrucomicrobia bacterium]|nr:class I SAM-dependent methyltransferase [Verrucomicrobiota bacterium]